MGEKDEEEKKHNPGNPGKVGGALCVALRAEVFAKFDGLEKDVKEGNTRLGKLDGKVWAILTVVVSIFLVTLANILVK